MRSIGRKTSFHRGNARNFLSFAGVTIEAGPHPLRQAFALLKSFHASFRFLLQA
jgi:hypothetical protein